jgi:hypothetical protein
MIFVSKGDPRLNGGGVEEKTQSFIDAEWPQWRRERSIRKNDGEFNTYMEQWEADMDTNRANEVFNVQLDVYRKTLVALEDTSIDDELRAYHQSFIDKTPTEVVEFYNSEAGGE